MDFEFISLLFFQNIYTIFILLCEKKLNDNLVRFFEGSENHNITSNCICLSNLRLAVGYMGVER